MTQLVESEPTFGKTMPKTTANLTKNILESSQKVPLQSNPVHPI